MSDDEAVDGGLQAATLRHFSDAGSFLKAASACAA
jgi:hypothetical protein